VRIIILDTDVASRLQRGTVPLDYLSALKTGTAAITFVTVAEMFKGAFKAAWGPSRIGQLESWDHRQPAPGRTGGDEGGAHQWALGPMPVEEKATSSKRA
jgi:hypothetical protein